MGEEVLRTLFFVGAAGEKYFAYNAHTTVYARLTNFIISVEVGD